MFKLFKLSSNQRGISLIEVMVAAGISGVIAMATMKIAENSQTAMRKVSADSDLNNFYNIRLQGGLGSDQGCMDAIGALTLDPGQTRTYATGESLTTNGFVLATVGQEIPNSTDWTLTSMLFERDATNTSLCRLVISLDRTERRSIGARSINKILEIGCHWDETTSPHTLVSCASNSTSTTEGYWTKENNGSTTWLEYDSEASSIFLGDYAGGTFPPARLSIKDTGSPYVWNTPVNEGIALSTNHAIRWGDVEADNAGIGIYADAANDLHVREGTTDYVTVQNGNVGIGTKTPAQQLHVHSAGTWSGTRVTTATTGNLASDGVNFGYDDAYGAYIWNRETTPVIISTSNTEKMRVDATGNVGIGTTIPGRRLAVAGVGNGSYEAIIGNGTPGQSASLDVITNHDTIGFQVWDDNDLGTPKFIVQRNGNVGIGHPAPLAKLDIQSVPGAFGIRGNGATFPANVMAYIAASSTVQIPLELQAYTGTGQTGDLFRVSSEAGGGDRLVVKANGRVGIGAPAPRATLDVRGFASVSDHGSGEDGYGSISVTTPADASTYASFSMTRWQNMVWGIGVNSANGVVIGQQSVATKASRTIDTPLFTLSQSGHAGIGIAPDATHRLYVGGSIAASAFYYSSDERLKKDIQTIESPLEKISLFRGVKFKWIESGEEDIGFIAQEVEEVEPSLVATDDSEEKMKSVKYGNITGLLVEALKELKEMVLAAFTDIDELKEENELLKARLDEQEERLDAQEKLLRQLASEKR